MMHWTSSVVTMSLNLTDVITWEKNRCWVHQVGSLTDLYLNLTLTTVGAVTLTRNLIEISPCKCTVPIKYMRFIDLSINGTFWSRSLKQSDRQKDEHVNAPIVEPASLPKTLSKNTPVSERDFNVDLHRYLWIAEPVRLTDERVFTFEGVLPPVCLSADTTTTPSGEFLSL